jgi:excisionase family DNA binding protein
MVAIPMSTALEFIETVQTHDDDVRLAEETIKRLGALVHTDSDRFQVSAAGSAGGSVEVSLSTIRILFDIVNGLAHGRAVTFVPLHAELPLQRAADFLNVSRSYLGRLLDEGKIRFREEGGSRRILFRDLVDYKNRSDAERRQALEELAALGQEIGEGN